MHLYNETVLHFHNERAPFLDLQAYGTIAFRRSASKPVSQEKYFGAKKAEGAKERGDCVDIDDNRITAFLRNKQATTGESRDDSLV